MRIEIPEFTRCCILFPLRQSLMIWACVRVLVAVGTLVVMSIRWATIVDEESAHKRFEYLVSHAEWLCFIIIVSVIEVILGLMYIVACQMKNLKLMKGYYYHNMFIMALIFALNIYDLVWYIIVIKEIGDFPLIDSIMMILHCIFLAVSYTALQAYGILLIRSEIRKLATGSDYRFENPIPEETLNIVQSNEEDDKKETEGDKKETEGDKKETDNVEEIIQIDS